MSEIVLDYSNTCDCVTESDIDAIIPEVLAAKELVDLKSGQGGDFLGWLDLPSSVSEELIKDIEETAEKARSLCDLFIVIGIGGSYLGARAAISALKGEGLAEFENKSGNSPDICFAGFNMSSSSLSSLLDLIKRRRVFVNVISKSGTTTEPAIALRAAYEAMKEKVGREEASKRFAATTDKAKGALKTLADREGWKTYVVPDDVGGRYSVLTPVGLLPIAVAGLDIRKMLAGARAAKENAAVKDVRQNTSCLYAAIRNILYRKGKKIEILSNFEQYLHYFGEWWKQLYGESEGKDGKGLYPDSLDFSTDLHSMGQYIQEGERLLAETFINVLESDKKIFVPHWEDNLDGLGYLEGKSLDYINSIALKGTAEAHLQGGVPNMEFKIPRLDEYFIGYMFYMFEYACAVSGYILGVNPFNQPGVEAYKQNMFRLLGKFK